MIAMITSIWVHPVTRLCASSILGIIIWSSLRLQYDHSRTIDVPVHVRGTTPSHVIAQEVLRLTITGPWEPLCRFIQQKPLASMDIAAHPHGLQEIRLTEEQINLPSSLHLASHPPILLFVNPYR